MRISDWSSDVCSSDLVELAEQRARRVLVAGVAAEWEQRVGRERNESLQRQSPRDVFDVRIEAAVLVRDQHQRQRPAGLGGFDQVAARGAVALGRCELDVRSEEHTSELQSLMRNSYAVFCLTK